MYLIPVGAVYDLASCITNRCSGLFYKDRDPKEFPFLNMFESAIGDLVREILRHVLQLLKRPQENKEPD